MMKHYLESECFRLLIKIRKNSSWGIFNVSVEYHQVPTERYFLKTYKASNNENKMFQ